MTTSRWRLRAREVIAQVLMSLPIGSSDRAKRAALRAAYPFGERRHHPYRAWLAEVRRALGTSSADGKRRGIGDVVVDPNAEDGPAVRCLNCHGSACLGCFTQRATFDRLTPTTDWATWRHWLYLIGQDPTDTLQKQAFADWLEESGWVGEASRVRAAAQR